MAIKIGHIRTSLPDSNQDSTDFSNGYATGYGNFYVRGSVGGVVGSGLWDIRRLRGGVAYRNNSSTIGDHNVDFYLHGSASYPNSFSLPNVNDEFCVTLWGDTAEAVTNT